MGLDIWFREIRGRDRIIFYRGGFMDSGGCRRLILGPSFVQLVLLRALSEFQVRAYYVVNNRSLTATNTTCRNPMIRMRHRQPRAKHYNKPIVICHPMIISPVSTAAVPPRADCRNAIGPRFQRLGGHHGHNHHHHHLSSDSRHLRSTASVTVGFHCTYMTLLICDNHVFCRARAHSADCAAAKKHSE